VKSKRLILTLLAASLIAPAFAARVSAAGLNLIPWPTKVETQPGQFILDSKTVVVTDAEFTGEAAALASDLKLKTAARAKTDFILLTHQNTDTTNAEAYQLEINNHGVIIRASSPAGAFYGCQTLRQLANQGTNMLPLVNISDTPRYAWRGLMLDVSRHFFDEPSVLRLVDWMAEYKLNRLHLHLTDDQGWRLEIQKYPGLTQIGARGNFSDSNAPAHFFSKSEIKEIVAYAAQRHIVVVPEIDMPGHAGAAIRTLPDLDGGTHTFNPTKPETYAFIQNVLLDVMENFPSPWIHFGGDEVPATAWNKTDASALTGNTNGLSPTLYLENDFDRKVAQFIQQQGRTPVGWDEITAAAPSTNTVVFWWRHDKPDILVRALASGYPVVLTPRAPCYFDYPQNENYPINAGRKLFNTLAAVYKGPQVPLTIPPEQLHQILGVEGCIWTERIGTTSYLEFMTLPRLAALGEMTWTPDSNRDFAQFDERLKPFLNQYRKAGYHFYNEDDPQGSLRDAKEIQAASRTPVSAGLKNN